MDVNLKSVKRLASAILADALLDYKINVPIPRKPKQKQSKKIQQSKRKHIINMLLWKHEDAKKWFDRKDRSPVGFYWCLHYSECNPNLVRKYLRETDKHNKKQLKQINFSLDK